MNAWKKAWKLPPSKVKRMAVEYFQWLELASIGSGETERGACTYDRKHANQDYQG